MNSITRTALIEFVQMVESVLVDLDTLDPFDGERRAKTISFVQERCAELESALRGDETIM